MADPEPLATRRESLLLLTRCFHVANGKSPTPARRWHPTGADAGQPPQLRAGLRPGADGHVHPAALGAAGLQHDLIGDSPFATFAEAFFNGARFDLRLVVYICVPSLLCLLSARAMAARRLQAGWFTLAASLCLLLGVGELNFYREFTSA